MSVTPTPVPFSWTLVTLLLLLSALWQMPVALAETEELQLDNGAEIAIDRFDAEAKQLLIWLPTERGFSAGSYTATAEALALLDVDVWVALLHDSYVIPPGRYSLSEMDLDDQLALLRQAAQQGFEEVYFLASSRAMQMALKTAYLWQQQNPGNNLLRGIISLYPHLLKGRPEAGEQAHYVQLAQHSNLPIYLLQPERSTKYARSWEIRRVLEQGGSPVFLHFLKDTQGGFHLRPDSDLQAADIDSREQLPQTLLQAMNLLHLQVPAPFHAAANEAFLYLEEQPPRRESPNLQAYAGDPNPAPLNLTDLQGKPWDFVEVQDQVVLVNFWATWCGPCVEEIPSLSRLVEQMQGRPFKVLAVNIGEAPETVQEFLAKIPVNFPVLLDPDSLAVRDWKVYAYPSNYLLDSHGKIRYAYRGALQWDAPEVVKVIDSLLPPQPSPP